MPQENFNTILNEAFRQIKESLRRLRILEERYDLLESELRNTQDNVLEKTTDLKQKLEKLENTIRDFEEKFVRIDNLLTKIEKNMEQTASINDVNELKNLLELYKPFLKKRT